MRRSIPVVLVVAVGLLLLVDFVVINPAVATLASGALELVVLLAAAAAHGACVGGFLRAKLLTGNAADGGLGFFLHFRLTLGGAAPTHIDEAGIALDQFLELRVVADAAR